MDRSRLADNCFKHPKDSTFHNYTLRSASKMNASRKQGLYSKFLKRANVTKNFQVPSANSTRTDIGSSTFGLKQNETVMSRIEQVETENSRQRNGFKQNETGISRIEQVETENSRRRNLFSENEPSVSRLDKGEISVTSNLLSDDERRIHPQAAINETRERLISPSKVSHQKNNLVGPSHVPVNTKYSSNTSFRSIQNSSFRAPMVPHVMLKRCDDLVDKQGRGIMSQSDNDSASVIAFSIKRQNELRMIDQEKRNIKKHISEATDCLSNAEAFYMLKRSEDRLLEFIRRKKRVEAELQPLTNGQENLMHVVDWLKSNDGSEMAAPIPSMISTAVKDYAASIITNSQRNVPSVNYNNADNNNRAAYALKDWTLIKGEGIFDVMLSGSLLNMYTGSLIEERHVSSTITAATLVIVQTNCCVYQLQGEFLNPGKCIPFSITKYFQDGKFPPEWKEVIKMWSILILSEKNREDATRHSRPMNSNSTLIPINRRVENLSDDEISVYNNEDEARDFRMPPSVKNNDRSERYQSNKEERRRIQDETNGSWAREPVNDRFKRSRYENISRAHDSNLVTNNEVDNRHDIRPRQTKIRIREHVTEQNERFQDSREIHRPSVSYIGQKRHFNNMEDDELGVNERAKRQKLEKNVPKSRLVTPADKSRISRVMTRSAIRRNGEIIQTPKSSKVSKLSRRNKTPMPTRFERRRICEEDESTLVDNSDLM